MSEIKIKLRHKYSTTEPMEATAKQVVENYLDQDAYSTECQIRSLEYKIRGLSEIIAGILTEDQVKEIATKTWGWAVIDGN